MDSKTPNLEDELAAVLSIEDEHNRAQSLIDLAPRLTEPLLSRAIDGTTSILDESVRARAISGLAPHLSKDLITVALSLTMGIGLVIARNEALGNLGPYLSEDQRAQVINTIKQDSEPLLRLKGWLGLAPYLTSELKQEALTTALTLNDWERADALIALGPHLPDVWKNKALAGARTIVSPPAKVRALSGLLTTLPKAVRADVLNEAIALTRELPPLFRAYALVDLLPHIPTELHSELLAEALEAASKSDQWRERVDAFVIIAGSQPPAEQHSIMSRALKSIIELEPEFDRGEALILIARSGPVQLKSEILTAAQSLKDSREKSRVLIQLQSVFDRETTAAGLPTPATVSSDAAPITPSQAEKPLTSNSMADVPSEPLPIPPSDVQQAKPPRSKAARRKPSKPEAAPPAQPAEPSAPTESVGVKTYLHSDKWTLDDQLNYSLYANAIAEFIRHKDTKPPLAIGILAPWGQGKTTLMNLIRQQLEVKEGREGGEKPNREPASIRPETTFALLRKWLTAQDYNIRPKKLDHATVWFNAWKYQNSEQVWAGMAYTILSQLVDQIKTPLEREKFWLALQAERLDFNAIRKDIHRAVFERVAPWLVVWLAVGLLGLLAFSFGVVTGLPTLSRVGMGAVTVSLLTTVAQWIIARMKVDQKPLEGKFAQYVRQPTYETKLGFFYEVEQDVRRVFDLLVDETNPVVVFIDDLDRCSPGIVAQIIEAMNLFLSGDFPNCYFVIGMDAQVVAASMEVAYENLDKKLRSVTRAYGSLGWYFMDKFIQLQFSIPSMTPLQRTAYLAKLFGQNADGKQEVAKEVLDQVEKQLENKLHSDALKAEELPAQAAELAKLLQQRPRVWERLSHTLIETGARQLSDDSPAVQKYLKRYEPYLGASPRGMKRFANLYRFYSLAQLSRQSQGLPACSPAALARWLVIMLRWPQVVRWIQWEGEAKLTSGNTAQDKAVALEERLMKTKTHEAWLELLKEIDPNQLEWLRDKQLYEFLKGLAGEDEKLSSAIETGVW